MGLQLILLMLLLLLLLLLLRSRVCRGPPLGQLLRSGYGHMGTLQDR
jgi:hypothetical protein